MVQYSKIFNTVIISLFSHYKKLFYKRYTFTYSIIIDEFRSLQWMILGMLHPQSLARYNSGWNH